ncbi:MAG: HAMP domain-containing histidine kinase [Clostridia bacterium]|nr:HAMP domain-containing histidine kinase [Clostridia bacterium]
MSQNTREKKKLKDKIDPQQLKKIGNFIFKERDYRFSLAILFVSFIACVLFISVVLLVVSIWLLSHFGVIGNFTDNPSSILVLIIVGQASVLISFGISFFLVKIPLKPINTLINHMNRLAAGDFKTRLSFGKRMSKNPTFKEISDSFNRMAEELENTEMLRGDFINNFSHEFKTPIVSIAGLAKLVNKGDLDEEQRSQYLSAIESESLRLADMATNVLNLTKVENQTILSDITEFNLSEQIRACVLLLENKWTQKEIELSLDFEELSIEGNEELLKQVWINLTDNAIKFSPVGGTVAIELEADGESVTVSVKNSGEIGESDRKKIWNKFYQADKSHTTEGNGIGLAIVKRIVELHGGAVGVESENGKVCFSVTLPCEQL